MMDHTRGAKFPARGARANKYCPGKNNPPAIMISAHPFFRGKNASEPAGMSLQEYTYLFSC